LLTDTSPGTTKSMSSSAGKRIPTLRGLKFIIFSTASTKDAAVNLDDRG